MVHIFPRFVTILILYVSGVLASGAHAAAVLNVADNGRLDGASGVDVGGVRYDVQFVEGSCIDVFSGCDATADFAFLDPDTAYLAASALLEQVFVDDSGLGLYDSLLAGLMRGCSFTLNRACSALTPYQSIPGGVRFHGTRNEPSVTLDAVDRFGIRIIERDTTLDDEQVWARWSLSPATAVHEPSTAALIAAAVLGLASIRRRSRRPD